MADELDPVLGRVVSLIVLAPLRVIIPLTCKISSSESCNIKFLPLTRLLHPGSEDDVVDGVHVSHAGRPALVVEPNTDIVKIILLIILNLGS